MKTKTTIVAIALILSFGINLYQYHQLQNTKLELSIADETIKVCEEETKKQEKQLGIAYQIINEYEILFPTSFMKQMYIDDSKLEELKKKLK